MHMRKMKYIPSPALLRSVILVPNSGIKNIFVFEKNTIHLVWSESGWGQKEKSISEFSEKKRTILPTKNVSLYRRKRIVIQTKTYGYTDKNVSLYRQKRSVIQTKTYRYTDKNVPLCRQKLRKKLSA